MKTKKLDKARAKAKAAESSVPKGKAANYPLAPWMTRQTYGTQRTGGIDAQAQRAAEMPSLSETMGLGNLPATTILRGQAVDAEGVSTNSKYARQQANPNINFKSGGKMKTKKYADGGKMTKTKQTMSRDGKYAVKTSDIAYEPGQSARSAAPTKKTSKMDELKTKLKLAVSGSYASGGKVTKKPLKMDASAKSAVQAGAASKPKPSMHAGSVSARKNSKMEDLIFRLKRAANGSY